MVTLSRPSDQENVSRSSSSGAFPPRFPHSARERAFIAGGLLACLALYLAAIDPSLYLWGDNAHYIIVAKSLATGQGLRDIHTPGSPRI